MNRGGTGSLSKRFNAATAARGAVLCRGTPTTAAMRHKLQLAPAYLQRVHRPTYARGWSTPFLQACR